MAKRHTIIDPTQPSMAKECKLPPQTNWKMCILCQADTDEPLQCPLRSKMKPIGAGYASLTEDLIQFKGLRHMPMDLNLNRLDDGDGVEATLMRHSAQWHKKCRLKFNKKMFLQQSKAESASKQQSCTSTPTVRTRSAAAQMILQSTEPICFFCSKPAGNAGLHHAATTEIDKNVRKCAIELGDAELLAKLSAGDMVAIEAKYHRNCLRALYNKVRPAAPKDEDADRLHGIAFAELVVFTEDTLEDGDNAPVFRLSDLANLYKTRLEQLGATVSNRVHTTRLKDRLLSALPDLRAHPHGRETLLLFERDIGPALKKACECDNDAIHLARAAQVVRREMFETKFTFDGTFKSDCQKDSVSPSLIALVNMILDGANIKHQTQFSSPSTTTAALTISQLLVFNSVKHGRNAESMSIRHGRERETPLPLYLSLKINSVTRSRSLIDTLFNLGLCVSYGRLLQLTADIANGVCKRFDMEEVVCPPKLRKRLFTTGAVDNIDHNPTSATAKDSFHGTSISLMQHPSHTNDGLDRGVVVIGQDVASAKSITPLPLEYTSVPPAATKTHHFTAPPIQGPAKPPDLMAVDAAVQEEYRWLRTVETALEKQSIDEWVSWSAYHASFQKALIPPAAINALLPLFVDSAHSVAMIKHSMTIVKAAIQHLNPGQVPLKSSLFLVTDVTSIIVKLIKSFSQIL
ncbi:uncharacterized protein [Diadema setosum]|uniref:uncharacterized protein n=1 Tax=Diadema setosum TaxID=31175 RepID=UPI003B3B8E91